MPTDARAQEGPDDTGLSGTAGRPDQARGRSGIPIVVLAAGASARMRGLDKLVMEIEGQPLLRRVVSRAVATGAPVLVVLPPDAPQRRAALGALKGPDPNSPQVVVAHDARDGLGASLRSGIDALPQDATAAMILLGDLPDLDTCHLLKVLDAASHDPDKAAWRGATEEGAPGHPVVMDRSLFDRVRATRGDFGAGKMLAGLGDRVRLVPLPGNVALADLDTPEDWARRQP